MIRDEYVTSIALIQHDAKVPKGAVALSRTVSGESVLLKGEQYVVVQAVGNTLMAALSRV